MRERAITLDMPVEEVMRCFPCTIAVFLRYRMHCVGCAMGTFHSVADAAHEYALEAPRLLAELRGAVAEAGGGG